MAVSFERLRARAGCCRIALQSASGEMLPLLSLVQRNALEDLMRRCTLDAEQRATFVDDVGRCNFTARDTFALVQMAVGDPKPPRTQKQWQD